MTDITDQNRDLLNGLFTLSGATVKAPEKKRKPGKRKSKAGGSRPGSGRPEGSARVAPELRRVSIAITIPQWLADSLTSTNVPPGRLIEAIIQFHLGNLEKIRNLF